METWEHRAILEGNKDPPVRPSLKDRELLYPEKCWPLTINIPSLLKFSTLGAHKVVHRDFL